MLHIRTAYKYSIYLKICLFVGVAYYRLCGCSMLIVILLPNCRLYRCSVVIVMLMFHNYRLCRCSVVIEMLWLGNYRLYSCGVLIVM